MDTGLLFLRDAPEEAINAYLDLAYGDGQRNWTVRIEGDPALYINVLRRPQRDMEPEAWDAACLAIGTIPNVVLAFNLSGRHFGSQEPRRFAKEILDLCAGCVMDDHSIHCWSVTELKGDHQRMVVAFLNGRRAGSSDLYRSVASDGFAVG